MIQFYYHKSVTILDMFVALHTAQGPEEMQA